MLSIFDFASSNGVIFKEGPAGWTGQFIIIEDPTVTEIGVSIESLDTTLKTFAINLVFSSCYAPSTFPSIAPSISTEPSVSPTECINDSNWYWNVNEGYGCAEVSASFCEDFRYSWYNGKNSLSACCVCGGGAHTT